MDAEILVWINGHHTAALDTFFWHVSTTWVWIPLYLYMLYRLYPASPIPSSFHNRTVTTNHQRMAQLLAIGAIVLAVVLTDQSCYWLKEWLARPRPTHTPGLAGQLHLVQDYAGGLYGMPSSHAANTMVASLLFALMAKCLDRPCQPWEYAVLTGYVLLNAYSRMYLGVHFPTDILVGWLIGAAVAAILGTLYRLAHKWYMVHD